MNNPLLTPSEQAHIDAVRAIQHTPDDHYPTLSAGQPTNAWEALTGFLARVDYAQVFRVVARLIIAVCVVLTFITLSDYWQVARWGVLPSVGQFMMMVVFFLVAKATDDDGILLLLAGLSILTALAF